MSKAIHYKPFVEFERALCGDTSLIACPGNRFTKHITTTTVRQKVTCPKCLKHMQDGTMCKLFNMLKEGQALMTPTS